jgi:hypothetical protein
VQRTLLAADDGRDSARASSGDADWRCSTNLDTIVRRWIEPALEVITPSTSR